MQPEVRHCRSIRTGAKNRELINRCAGKYPDRACSRYIFYRSDDMKTGQNRNGMRMSPAGLAAESGVLIALAMIFSYVESLIPLNFGVPGIKLGLANLVVLSGLYYLNPGQVVLISIGRILLTGFLFGNMSSIIYSLAGGLLSFFVMLLLVRFDRFSVVGVSVAGAVCHNIGQIAVACLVVRSLSLIFYLPVLIISGVVTGFLMGMLTGRVLPVLRKVGLKARGHERNAK